MLSLNVLFESYEDLIDLNIFQINSPNISSYSFTFLIAKILVILTSIDSSNLEKEDFLFSRFSNLVV